MINKKMRIFIFFTFIGKEANIIFIVLNRIFWSKNINLKGFIMENNVVSKFPGNLENEPVDGYKTLNEHRVLINIEKIQNWSGIPDYRLESHADCPVLVKDSMGVFCIDGFSLVEETRNAGQTEICCKVYEVAEHSELELDLRKREIRKKTEGGVALYAEDLRNISLLAKRVVTEQNNPKLKAFYHGGCRRGEIFKKETDFVSLSRLIAAREGASESNIRKQTGYTRYISGDTFEKLINAHCEAIENRKATEKDNSKEKSETIFLPVRAFFEKISTEKSALVKPMEGAQTSEKQITKMVSKQVLVWWEEYRKSGTVTPLKKKKEMPDPPQKKDEEIKGDGDDEKGNEGNTNPQQKQEPPATFSDFKLTFLKSAQTIITLFEAEKPSRGLAEKVKEEIKKLNELYQTLNAMIPDDEREVK